MPKVGLLCICSHHQLDHGSMEGCWYKLNCGCMKFKMDNLKYLEDKYEQLRTDR